MRGHSLKLFKENCNLDIRKYCFAHRIIENWNSLDEEIIACNTVNTFKSKLDTFLTNRGFI